ncbi:MAG TPA: hypothetical protein VJP60_01830 [Rhizomicrobium sp.]|nr:hypothetical protein [Rhizomicrobium sp.]
MGLERHMIRSVLALMLCLLTLSSAQAVQVKAAIGKSLNQALVLANAGNFKAALAKLDEANAVPLKTKTEIEAIAQTRVYIGAKAADPSIGGTVAAKWKFANDWNAHRYKDVIADFDMLQKYNALDDNAKQIVAQAYYKAGDKMGCVRYIKRTFHAVRDPMMNLYVRCAYEANDKDTLESLGLRAR